MKAIGTVAMVVAAAAAVGVVILVGTTDATESKAEAESTPAANTTQEAKATSAPAAPATFPEYAFPKQWNFYPGKPDIQRALQRNIGKTVPMLVVGDFLGEGGAKELSKLRGKPILIDFWATWCGPCRASIPHINEVASKHADELHVIGIHSTRQASKMAATAKKLGMEYPTAADLNNRTSTMLGVQWWPFYVLIDSKGVIRAAGMSSVYVGDAVQRLLDIEAGRWPVK